MTWLEEEAVLRDDLERIEAGGYAFELVGTHVRAERQEAGYQWPAVGNWEPPHPRPEQAVRQLKSGRNAVRDQRQESPPPDLIGLSVTCNAPDAFSIYSYTGCFAEAARRLAAGAHQARCLNCFRYRWADEPCGAARFAGGKGPRPEQVSR